MALSFLIANAERLSTTAMPIVPGSGSPPPGGLTMSMWFKNAGVQSWAFTMGRTDASTRYCGFLMGNGTANSLKIVRRSTGHKEAEAGNTMGSGEWNHCFGRIHDSGSFSDCILNGDLGNTGTNVTSGTGDFNLSNAASQVYIGDLAWSGGGQYTTGGMAHCAVWTGLLSDGDAVELSKGYSPLFFRPEWLRFYATLEDPSDVGRDLIAPNKHWRQGPPSMTVVNSPAFIPGPPIIYPDWFHIGMRTVHLPHVRRRPAFVPAAAPPAGDIVILRRRIEAA